jgi:predicted lactoylglutathione lyase
MSTASNSSQTNVQFLQRQAASLLIYQSVLQGEVSIAFLNLLQTIRYPEADARSCLQAYGNYFKCLAAINQNWEDYLITQILRDENPFSRLAQQREFENLPPALIAATQHDLQALQSLYECSSAFLSEWVQAVAHLAVSPVVWYDEQLAQIEETKESLLIAKLHHMEDWA